MPGPVCVFDHHHTSEDSEEGRGRLSGSEREVGRGTAWEEELQVKEWWVGRGQPM